MFGMRFWSLLLMLKTCNFYRMLHGCFTICGRNSIAVGDV